MKNEVFDLEKIEVSKLPELANLTTQQKKAVEDYPFIEIVDSKTYAQAKANRTALVSARTSIQEQDSVIASKLKNFRSLVSIETAALIEITKPSEDKQQAEVKRYEAEQLEIKQAKAKAEAARIKAIEDDLKARFEEAEDKISSMTFNSIDSVGKWIEESSEIDPVIFAELSPRFDANIEIVSRSFERTKITLENAEKQRLEKIELQKAADKLAADQAKFAADQKAIKAKADEKAKAEKAKQDAKNKKIADEQKAAQAKIDSDRKILEDQKAALQKIEDDKAAKIKADADAKEAAEKAEADAKAEKKRQDLLRPDKEQVLEYVNGLDFTIITDPKIKDSYLDSKLKDFIAEIEKMKTDFIEEIENY